MIRFHAGLGALAAVAALSAPALAITPYYQENFVGAGNLAGWGGGTGYSNPGTGGVDGANDGYLRVMRDSVGNFGARSGDPVYGGDYVAQNITGMSLWLNDVDASQDFHIYVSVGNALNLWQYNAGFTPANNVWTEYFVDFTNASLWNPIGFASTTFQDALMSADRILIRNDMFPGTPTGSGPVPIAGELGIDKITFVPAPGAGAVMLGGLLGLARRRR